MAGLTLNPAACEWYPAHYQEFEEQDDLQYSTSPDCEALEEMRAMDDWVSLMADLEEVEEEHLSAITM